MLVPEGLWKWVGKYRFWLFGPPACFSALEGKQKLKGREEQLPTSFLPNQVTCSPSASLGRTKRICLDLEYKPRLESGNALEGTLETSVLQNLETVHQSLISPMGKGLSTPISICSTHILSGRKLPNPCPAGPIQPEFFKTSFLETSSPGRLLAVPLCCSSLMPCHYALMSRTAWPHYLVGTTNTLVTQRSFKVHGSVQGHALRPSSTRWAVFLAGSSARRALQSQAKLTQACTTPDPGWGCLSSSQAGPFPAPSSLCPEPMGPPGLCTRPFCTPRLCLYLPLLCLLQRTLNALGGAQRKLQWVKTPVEGSSEGNPPMRRMRIKNWRKYPSGFPWELYPLRRTEVSPLRM